MLEQHLKISELNSAIRNLKPKKAPGPDGVSNDMLKHLGLIARKTLLEIFNRSWNKGLVPEVWKTAHLVPVLKKGKDKTNRSSYHRISVLICIGKLMECVIHLSSHLVLGDQQRIQPLTDRVPSTSQHWSSACTPHSRHWKLLPREAKAASSLFWPVKGVRLDCSGNYWEQEFQVKCTNGSAAFFTTECPEWSLMDCSAERSG